MASIALVNDFRPFARKYCVNALGRRIPPHKKASADASAYKMASQRRVEKGLLEDRMEEDEAALAQEYYTRFYACRA
jgi:hypothetical protein